MLADGEDRAEDGALLDLAAGAARGRWLVVRPAAAPLGALVDGPPPGPDLDDRGREPFHRPAQVGRGEHWRRLGAGALALARGGFGLALARGIERSLALGRLGRGAALELGLGPAPIADIEVDGVAAVVLG